ncbi:putative membrane protein [Toxoplasma gondii RUB]|uniref:Putative membrane protein n=10 Tax=Toxoplasma gondii TaxID=5811 RepID=S7URK6_TOXGG|nr:putative membrane protein [Toxoplasma gondii GT1]KAF4643334.1 putative membrane protein [Toxoplasma gondii]KFG27914.1 putative membrane protein [Toxoplasma gondii p89]KFG32848.1 putative membrane protein [Toxoplasma gondii FOU]KFG39215.1 putative membrane protein [Toxoplasma gondii GAB2-2007-GAL-DOM2]KFG56797.1 putative membrane protein [Toxoplasma gondii RUB]KFH01789.1 putative membrane protein [Toxoplasma gondii MAS]KFH04460.1 putative membrane protein [Toxoplasma gondii VAND]PUA83449.
MNGLAGGFAGTGSEGPGVYGSNGGAFGPSSSFGSSLISGTVLGSLMSSVRKVDVTRELVCKGTVSACVGIALGIIASLIVNCTLVEISMSSFFSFYFGLLFVTVGSVILWRIQVTSKMAADVSVGGGESDQPRKMQLQFFAALIIASGILCFVLKKNWFVGLHPVVKVPLYTLLGIAVAFALTFSLVDMVNYLLGFFQSSVAKPLVESKEQVNLVLFTALLMGGLFGFIFGVLDVEDEVQYHVRLALLREQHLCYPIGAILGGLAGLGNEILRQADEAKFRKLATEFDEEI